MPQALIVAGYEPYQLQSSQRIARSLLDHTRIRYAPVLDVRTKSERLFAEHFQRALRNGRNDDLLVIWFNVHGSETGFLSLDRDDAIHVDGIAGMIAESDRRVLLVINSCHSGLMADALEAMGADAHRVGCIMACASDMVTYNHYLLDGVLYQWERHQVYQQEVMESWSEVKHLAPVGQIRVGNRLLRSYDQAAYVMQKVRFELLRAWNPERELTIASHRWGARLDPLIWQKPRRRR
jgi:hypothetical protein